jgi:integral membrane protein
MTMPAVGAPHESCLDISWRKFDTDDSDPKIQNDRLGRGEFISALLFVAMPMKYLMGMPRVVTVVGAIHGILFLAYVAQLAKLRTIHQWDNRFSFLAFLASLLPFGPFVFDKHLREKEVGTN